MDEFPSIEYGSDEHLDGLSRDALKADLRWWWDRAEEMEAENARLRELVCCMWLTCKSQGIYGGVFTFPYMNSNTEKTVNFRDAMCELGIEVD